MDGSISRPPSSQVNCQRSFNPAKHLTLQPTGTEAFPSTFDGLGLWSEGEGKELDSNPHLAENFQVPQDSEMHGAGMAIRTPPLSGDQSPLLRHTLPTRHSNGIMQRIRRAGARIKSLVRRQKRSTDSGGLIRSSSSGVAMVPGSDDGSVEIAAPLLHGKFPSTSLPPQIPPLSFDDGGTPSEEAEASPERLPKLILYRSPSKRASTSGSVPSREGRTSRTFKRLSLAT